MKIKNIFIPPCKEYDAKIYRYTDGIKAPENAFVYSKELHWHYAYEMIYVLKGNVVVNKLDSSVELKANDIYMVNTQEIHSIEFVNKQSDIIFINTIPRIAFRPVFDMKKAKVFKPFIEGEAKAYIEDSLCKLALISDYEDHLNALKIKSLLYNIIYYLLQDFLDMSLKYHCGSDLEDFDCAKKAINYIINNYKKDLSLSEISKYVGMAPAHFSKYFKEKTSVTFSSLLQKIRLESARKDMMDNKITVKAAADNNGFPNVNAFITAYKAEFGHTPAEMKSYHEGF